MEVWLCRQRPMGRVKVRDKICICPEHLHNALCGLLCEPQWLFSKSQFGLGCTLPWPGLSHVNWLGSIHGLFQSPLGNYQKSGFCQCPVPCDWRVEVGKRSRAQWRSRAGFVLVMILPVGSPGLFDRHSQCTPWAQKKFHFKDLIQNFEIRKPSNVTRISAK